jgi:hypothetical protein
MMPKHLEEIVDIQDAQALHKERKIKELLNQTKAFSRDEFSRLLLKCRNIIRNNDKLSPEAAFDEISKVLFIKICSKFLISRLEAPTSGGVYLRSSAVNCFLGVKRFIGG